MKTVLLFIVFLATMPLYAQKGLKITIKENNNLACILKNQDINKYERISIKGVLTSEDIHLLAQKIRDVQNLKELNLKRTTTKEFGMSLFENCIYLEKISIPKHLTTIGKNAFKNCQQLNDITIRKEVTSIGSYSFENCTSLKKIKIGKKVSWIGKNCFLNCRNLKKIKISKRNKSLLEINTSEKY